MPGLLTTIRTGAAAVALGTMALAVPAAAQGLIQGVEQGARDGSRAAGPVGGVLGGAIGGMVGVVTGVLGVPGQQKQAPAQTETLTGPKQGMTPGKGGKSAKAERPVRPVAPAATPMTSAQIVSDSDANIARIKAELKLTPEQEKNWGGFNSAMHYLGQHGAERFELRIARAKRDPPDDIVEQMRNEAQFLYDRGADQRAVADAAEPLFSSLDARQKAIFISEMVKLSRERGLD